MSPLTPKFLPALSFHTLLLSLLVSCVKRCNFGCHCELLFLLLVQRLNTTAAPPAIQICVVILSYTAIAVQDLSPASL